MEVRENPDMMKSQAGFSESTMRRATPILLLLAAVLSAQENPVSWTVEAPAQVTANKTFTVEVQVTIDLPYHIYGLDPQETGQSTAFSASPPDDRAVVTDDPAPSRAARLHDDEYSKYTYWEHQVAFQVPVTVKGAEATEKLTFELVMDYMACTNEGCLPPMTLTREITVAVAEGEEVADPAGAGAQLDGEAVPGREVDLLIPLSTGAANVGDRISKGKIRFSNDHLSVVGDGIVEVAGDALVLRLPVLVHENLADGRALDLEGRVHLDSGEVRFAVAGSVSQPIAAFILLAAVAALFALLTPCVFPMIPITISFFTKQAESAPYPPVTMGIVYCMGIVLSFTAIGVLFTLALGPGGAIAFAQSRVTLGLIALLFIVFALSLFGMFELKLPASVMNLAGRAQGKGGLVGVLLLGLLFAVTSFACTAPFVGTILAGAAASGAWTRPVVGMVVFSGVLAVPFFFLSIFPSRLKSMPRSGGWLNEVKVVMGFIEIAAAFKFLGDMEPTIFTRFLILCVWTVTFGACGVYLLGLFRLPHDGLKEKVGALGMVFALFFLSFALYCTKGLDGESLAKDIDAYLPDEVVVRTPLGRRQAIVKELGLVSGADRVGYDRAFHYWDKDRGQVVDENPYGDAIAEAKRLGTALFIDFTGYA